MAPKKQNKNAKTPTSGAKKKKDSKRRQDADWNGGAAGHWNASFASPFGGPAALGGYPSLPAYAMGAMATPGMAFGAAPGATALTPVLNPMLGAAAMGPGGLAGSPAIGMMDPAQMQLSSYAYALMSQ